jgi:hypothetical protein
MVSRNRKIARRIGQAVANDVLDISGAISAGAGVTVYATVDDLPTTGLTAGDEAFISGSNRLYISNGTGWYSIGLINTNPSITSVQDPSANTTPFTLATDGSALVLTITAADPEDVPLTYSYAVTTGSLTNGGGTTATIVQGTGANTNQFTITPTSTEAYAGTFELTFTASDGINQASSVNSFTLEFITIITNSNYTTLLATATGTSDNNDITDASTNNHTITVVGDAHAGTFSPYRHGGYSTYFDGSSDNLSLTANSGFSLDSNINFTIECWFNPSSITLDSQHPSILKIGTTQLYLNSSNNYVGFYHSTNDVVKSSNSSITENQWYHVSVTRSGSVLTLFLDGVLVDTRNDSTGTYGASTGTVDIGTYSGTGGDFHGYISDLRIVKGTAITPPSGGPTERLQAVTNTSLLTCHLPYIADGSTNNHSITINGNTSTKPFSPYDYLEYSATDHGGSVFIEANGGHLSGTLSSGGLGTTFTVEMWIYDDGTGGETTYGGYFTTTDLSSQYGIQFRRYGAYIFNSTTGTNLLWAGNGDPFATVFGVGWHHVAAVHNGSTFKVYVDGKEIISRSDSHTYSSVNYKVGQPWLYLSNSSTQAKAYISDLRINKSVIYSGEFTPPTAPLSSSGTELHIKGTDASIIDKAQGANLKLVGNTTGSTTQAKFASSKSMYFDGSGDYIDTNKNLQGDFGTGDFTVEGWFYLNEAIGATRVLLGSGTGDGNDEFMLALLSNGTLYYDWFSVSDYIQSVSTITAYTWHHIAVTRSGTQLDLWLDGTSVASNSSHSHNYNGTSTFKIGMSRVGTYFWNGYIQDVRITNGLARYTANFTPPTASLEG